MEPDGDLDASAMRAARARWRRFAPSTRGEIVLRARVDVRCPQGGAARLMGTTQPRGGNINVLTSEKLTDMARATFYSVC